VDPIHDEPQGCFARVARLGMAFYALLLLGMICAGTTCAMGTSVLMTFSGQGADRGSGLVAGFEAPAGVLAELRRQSLLADQRVPELFHDHSSGGDGRSGCAVIGAELLRWDDWAETNRVPLSGTEIEVGDFAVTVRAGEQAVTCPLPTDGDAERLGRMLTVEAAR